MALDVRRDGLSEFQSDFQIPESTMSGFGWAKQLVVKARNTNPETQWKRWSYATDIDTASAQQLHKENELARREQV